MLHHPNNLLQRSIVQDLPGNYHKGAFSLLESMLYSSKQDDRRQRRAHNWVRIPLFDKYVPWMKSMKFFVTEELIRKTPLFPDKNPHSFPIMRRGGGQAGNISWCRGRCSAGPQLAAWSSAACHKSTLNDYGVGGFWETVWQPEKQLKYVLLVLLWILLLEMLAGPHCATKA